MASQTEREAAQVNNVDLLRDNDSRLYPILDSAETHEKCKLSPRFLHKYVLLTAVFEPMGVKWPE